MCSKGIAKCFLVLFNVLFLLLGAILLALGILFLQDADELLDKIPAISQVDSIRTILKQVKDGANEYGLSSAESLLTNASYILIAIGAFLFIYGFLGFVGACKESKCLLYLYAICVAVILLVEAAAIILCAVYWTKIEDTAKDYMKMSLVMDGGYEGITFGDTMEPSLVFPDKPLSLAWDTIQITMKCCGVTNQSDFMAAKWNMTLPPPWASRAQVPPSCCSEINPDNIKDLISKKANVNYTSVLACLQAPDDDNSHVEGCLTKMMGLVDEYLYLLIGITAGIVLIEILAIVAACSIAKAEKD